MDCKTRQKYMLSEVDVIDRHTFYNIEYAHAATAVTAVVMQAPRSPVDRYRFCPLQAPQGKRTHRVQLIGKACGQVSTSVLRGPP